MRYTFNFRDIWAQRDFIVQGIAVTLLLTLVSSFAGLAIGAVAPQPAFPRGPGLRRSWQDTWR